MIEWRPAHVSWALVTVGVLLGAWSVRGGIWVVRAILAHDVQTATATADSLRRLIERGRCMWIDADTVRRPYIVK